MLSSDHLVEHITRKILGAVSIGLREILRSELSISLQSTVDTVPSAACEFKSTNEAPVNRADTEDDAQKTSESGYNLQSQYQLLNCSPAVSGCDFSRRNADFNSDSSYQQPSSTDGSSLRNESRLLGRVVKKGLEPSRRLAPLQQVHVLVGNPQIKTGAFYSNSQDAAVNQSNGITWHSCQDTTKQTMSHGSGPVVKSNLASGNWPAEPVNTLCYDETNDTLEESLPGPLSKDLDDIHAIVGDCIDLAVNSESFTEANDWKKRRRRNTVPVERDINGNIKEGFTGSSSQDDNLNADHDLSPPKDCNFDVLDMMKESRVGSGDILPWPFL
jgi:hypothetical protein